MFPSKQLLVTVQQFVLLCPHDLPCVITITNIEKTLVQWVVPMQWHVSMAANSTCCKPQKCDMSKRPLLTSPFKAEHLPPRQYLQSSEVVVPSTQRSCGQLFSSPPLTVVLWLYSLSCDGGTYHGLEHGQAQTITHILWHYTFYRHVLFCWPIGVQCCNGGITPHAIISIDQHQLQSIAGVSYGETRIHCRYYHFWLHRWVHHPPHGTAPYVTGCSTSSLTSS